MSQLPADYLINRISLPSQQAIVLSARSYLEYSYVYYSVFFSSEIFLFLEFRFRVQLSKLFINLVSDNDLHKPGSIYKLIIRYIRQKHPNIVHIIDDVNEFFWFLRISFNLMSFFNLRMEMLMIYQYGQLYSIVYVLVIYNQH